MSRTPREPDPSRANPGGTDPASWVDQFGDALFRFALMRLGDRSTAEDIVQETFLAALKAVEQFSGEARVSTWLFAILRRKISDHFRTKKVEPGYYDESIASTPSGGLLDGQPLKRWQDDPAELFEEREFWIVFHSCARKLPEKLAEAYLLRDIDGISPKEVCEILEISPTNLSMRVYRARLLMRHCLEKHWFDQR